MMLGLSGVGVGVGVSTAHAQVPGWQRIQLSPVTPAESEARIAARWLPANLNQTQSGSPLGTSIQDARLAKTESASLVGSANALGAPSVAELARALRNDPDLIYDYVRNTIAYYPVWGMQKGAFGAMLDNSGTAFDQADLLVALLRQAGYTASFVKGQITLSATQVHDWLGVNTSNICAVFSLLSNGGIPYDPAKAIPTGSYNCTPTNLLIAGLVTIKFDHVWVKATINGTSYYFDPSFKPHSFKTGIDLTVASGYNATNFLTNAKQGATQTADYIQNLNRTAIRNNLTTYAGNLATYLRSQNPTAALDDVIGGQTIIPYTGADLRQTALPYRDTSVAMTEWTDLPANYKSALRVQFAGIDQTLTSDAIYGKRLSLLFNTSLQPQLILDGQLLATGTAQTAGATGSVTFTVTHAVSSANQQVTQQVKAGTANIYSISNGWGASGRGLIEQHRKKVVDSRVIGSTDTSESVLGGTLAILAATWITETDRAAAMTDRLAKTNTLVFHRFGLAGYQDNTAYVDLPGNIVSVISDTKDSAAESAVFYSSAMHGSILESVAVQQVIGTSAVSTVKLVDMAIGNGYRIYDAKAANYAAIATTLVSCSNWTGRFQSAVSAGARLILPSQCNIAEANWSGVGYFDLRSNSIGAIIGSGSGSLLGGAGTSSTTPANAANFGLNTSINTLTNTGIGGYTLGDPIDLVRGNYLYAHEDINVGVGEFPQALNLRRQYNSAMRGDDGSLGRGWTHNLASRATVSSDGFQAMGEDSALDAVGTLIEQWIALDLLKDPAKPLDKILAATVGMRWFGDQLLDNTVIVRQGLNAEAFVKLPDGSYNPPPGNATRLTKNPTPATGYTYETLHKSQLNFATTGTATGNFLLTTYTQPDGIQAKFTYSGNNLTSVQNSLGRTLTFTYTGSNPMRISKVRDGIRTAGPNYTYDTNGNLITYTDSLTKATTFQYDLPGRMTKLFYPNNPANPFATNVYDTLSRVQTQTNANNKLWQYYFAGFRSEEVAPDGSSNVSWIDANGKITDAIDPLGRLTLTTYDGQSRPIRIELPDGNAVETDYDDAPCATQNRCTHNPKTIRQLPKPGSSEPILTRTFSYEPAFNRIATATDARGQTTNFTYTPQGLPATLTAPADPNGLRPSATTSYTAYPSTLFGYPQFYLPTSVTQTVSATENLTSTTTYLSTRNYVPQTFIRDAGASRLNLQTTYTYDTIGNLTYIDGPRTDVADTQALAYDTERRPISSTNALNKTTYRYYDADGQLIRTASPIGVKWLVSCHSYSFSGKLLKTWGPAETTANTTCPAAVAPTSVTDFAYDDLDRPIRTTQNLPTSEGGNRISETVYFPDGKPQKILRGVGTLLEQTAATYSYTPNGQLATLTDAKNNLTRYIYNGHDRLTATQYPNPTNPGSANPADQEQQSYDANGNVINLIKRNGQSLTFAYDNLNRLISRNYPNPALNTSYTYDLLSHRTAARYTNGGHDINTTYDTAGRPINTTAAGRALTTQYDPAGNRTRLTWPDGYSINTNYDALNRPLSYKEGGTVPVTTLATTTWDDLSRRATLTLGNGTTSTATYNTQGNLATLTHNLTGTNNDLGFSYARNQIGDITVTTPLNPQSNWTLANPPETRTANGLNQYTTRNTTPITHDPNGNLQSDGIWTYGHDLDNRLTTAVRNNPAGNASLGYDPVGRLNRTDINGTVTDLLYDGTDLIAEYDGTGTLTTRHIHGPGMDEPLVSITGTSKTWRYADHLGSIIAEADATGNATAIRGYGPFGENGTTPPNRFGYTGQQYIAGLGLYYYKARWYSPTLGRFLETDPIGYADGVNWYAYVGNSPVNRRDPTGLYWFQQNWQAVDPIVGRSDTFVWPGGPISTFIEQYVPAGRTLAELHDPLVGALRSAGVPDWLANIPTMLPTYVAAVGTEMLRTLGIVGQPTPLPAQPTPSK
ncbi:hypothetical protein W01_04470 [Candidatus Nitrotoga sp. AM1P]|nr:hypothetical protein W01_04470 [Candidatus Nitrotoga sp. AM1P]